MTQGRNWLCTLNNPTEFGKDYLEQWSKVPGVLYVTGQLEKGEEGTPHLQYFVHYEKNQRLAGLKKHCSRSHF